MMRSGLVRLILFVLLAVPVSAGFFLPAKALAADPKPDWRLIEPAYPTADTFVAAYSVKDFGASGDGDTDMTGIFQKLLDALGRLGGGTLFVPEGRYYAIDAALSSSAQPLPANNAVTGHRNLRLARMGRRTRRGASISISLS